MITYQTSNIALRLVLTGKVGKIGFPEFCIKKNGNKKIATLQENFNTLKGITFAYVGDGRNNMANSLMIGCAKMGIECRIISPKSLFPEQELVRDVENIAKETGGKIVVTDSVDEGIKGVDVIYTDVWASMGEEAEMEERIRLLKPYQVNMDMIKKTGKENPIFLHCLPAFHNDETIMSKDTGAMEVTDEVFESKYSKVFDQAENRLHTIKAVMVATMGVK
jgi:ornithine carbamoyltransferase